MSGNLRWQDFILPVVAISIAVGYTVHMLNNLGWMEANFISLDYILTRLRTHLYLVSVSVGLAILTALPLGVLLTRPKFRKITPLVVGIVNLGQTIPSFAVIALFVGILGIGARTAIFALWAYSLLPILNNTIAGVNGVDKSIIDAARGMGMTKAHTLIKIELPLSIPVIMAGIRTAVVINAGTAIIASYVGAGGLGDIIVTGMNINSTQTLLLGAGYATIVALLLDHFLGLIERQMPR